MGAQFTVLGDGGWGTAIGLLLAKNPSHQVTLWSARTEYGQLLREKRENISYLPGVSIPESIKLTSELAETPPNPDLIVVAIPTIFLRSTLTRIAPHFRGSRGVVSLTKGLEIGTFERPSQIIAEILKPQLLGVLSGPSHAEEVARGMPASVVAASGDMGFAGALQAWFSAPTFRVYTNADLVGVELAGALKNIIGIAAGICDGLGFGDNAKSALLTRAIVEMARFGTALGAKEETFYGLAGLGDLLTTCFSPHGRNRRVGERLGHGEKLDQILSSMVMVAEGVSTSKSVYEEARSLGIDMPISNEVYRVLYENKDPKAAVVDLMTRERKTEN